MLRSLSNCSLLIAAAGYEPKGGGCARSLSGSAGGRRARQDGNRAVRFRMNPKLGKPELFMLDDLASTPLSLAIKAEVFKERRLRGSSFSALHAVAAAALVWSILPELSPRGIRALLLEALQAVERSAGTASAHRLRRRRAGAPARGGAHATRRPMLDGNTECHHRLGLCVFWRSSPQPDRPYSGCSS